MQPIKNNSSLLKTILGLYMFLIIVSTVNDFITLHILNNFGNGIIPDYVDQFDDYTTVFNMLFLVILISVFIIQEFGSTARINAYDFGALKIKI